MLEREIRSVGGGHVVEVSCNDGKAFFALRKGSGKGGAMGVAGLVEWSLCFGKAAGGEINGVDSEMTLVALQEKFGELARNNVAVVGRGIGKLTEELVLD